MRKTRILSTSVLCILSLVFCLSLLGEQRVEAHTPSIDALLDLVSSAEILHPSLYLRESSVHHIGLFTSQYLPTGTVVATVKEGDWIDFRALPSDLKRFFSRSALEKEDEDRNENDNFSLDQLCSLGFNSTDSVSHLSALLSHHLIDPTTSHSHLKPWIEAMLWKDQKGALTWNQDKIDIVFKNQTERQLVDDLRSTIRSNFDHLKTNFLSTKPDSFLPDLWTSDLFLSASQLVLSRSTLVSFPDLACAIRILTPLADFFNHSPFGASIIFENHQIQFVLNHPVQAHQEVFVNYGDLDSFQWASDHGLIVKKEPENFIRDMELKPIERPVPKQQHSLPHKPDVDSDLLILSQKQICPIVTSLGDPDKKIEDQSLFQILLPSLISTISEQETKLFSFKIMVGFDEADVLYDNPELQDQLKKTINEFENKPNIKISLIRVKDEEFKKHPARILSGLANMGYWDGCDYFYQINDDVKILTKNWIQPFIQTLANNPLLSNLGVVSPTDVDDGPQVATQAFFHRTHLELFGSLFPFHFKNWFSDIYLQHAYSMIDSHFVKEDSKINNTNSRSQDQPKNEEFTSLNIDLKQSAEVFVDHLSVVAPDKLSQFVITKKLVQEDSFDARRKWIMFNMPELPSSTYPYVLEMPGKREARNNVRDQFPCLQLQIFDSNKETFLKPHHVRLGSIDDKILEMERKCILKKWELWQSGNERRSSLKKVVDDLMDKSTTVKNQKEKGGKFSNTLIITLSNWGQIKMTENWLHFLGERKLDNMIVFCLDQQSDQYLQSKGITTFFHPTIRAASEVQNFGKGDYKKIVDIKPLIVLDLLMFGVDVFLMDNDVVFLKDVLEILGEDKRELMIQDESPGNLTPIVNSGFYWVKGSGILTQMFNDIVLETQVSKLRDQQAFNFVLQKIYKDFFPNPALRRRQFPNGFMFFYSQRPKVHRDEPAIVHNNHINGYERKIHRFREHFMWAIDDDSYFFLDSTSRPPSDNLLALSHSISYDQDPLEDQEGRIELDHQGEEKRKRQEQEIIQKLIQDPPTTQGKIMTFVWNDPSVQSLGDQRKELITAFLISEALNRTLVLPRMRLFERQKYYDNVEWITAEYVFDIGRFNKAGLQFRENSLLTNPRVLNNIQHSPLQHSVFIDLNPPQTAPFQGDLVGSSIFGDPLIYIRFLIADPVVIKTEEKMGIEEIKQKLGQGSVFGEVPFLVFSHVFGRISTEKQAREYRQMNARVLIHEEHGFLLFQPHRDLDDPS